MSNPFQKASRSQVFLKLAITGPTGSGKTLSALRMAAGLIEPGQRIAFEDTENDSASLYADMEAKQCQDMNIPNAQIEDVMATSRLFDVMPIAPPFAAESFSSGIDSAVAAGYGAVVIDSASHFWKGILTYKDQLDGHGGTNKFANWKKADEKFDPVIERVLQSKIHIIFCMRSKIAYEMDEQTKKVSKVGLAPIMRDNLEYEFSTVLDIGHNHTAMASKDRTGLFPNDKPFMVTEQTGRDLSAWLKTATPKPEPPPPVVLSDDEAKLANIALIREEIKKRSKHPEFECEFCRLGSALHEDARERVKLEDYTLQELRDMFPKRATVYKMTSEKLNAVPQP